MRKYYSIKKFNNKNIKSSSYDYSRVFVLFINIIISGLNSFVSLIAIFFITLDKRFGSFNLIRLFSIGIVTLLILGLIPLFQPKNSEATLKSGYDGKVYLSRRGTIYGRNYSNNQLVALTTSEQATIISYDAVYLKNMFDKNIFKLDDIVQDLSANLNLSWNIIKESISKSISKQKLSLYEVLVKDANNTQANIVESLRNSDSKYLYSNWLSFAKKESRGYPQGKLLAQTLGYLQYYQVGRDEALSIDTCRKMVENNERRQTVNSFTGYAKDGAYTVGRGGLEEKFCSELGGLNGRTLLGQEFNGSIDDTVVQDGSDVTLTIDVELQKNAEDILRRAVDDNKSVVDRFKGQLPDNGTILVVNLEDSAFAKAGAILAMASFPEGDPGRYELNDYVVNGGFRNSATSIDYEPGSVIKPLTVATGLSEWFKGSVDKSGSRVGLDPNWQWQDYGASGKKFEDSEGVTRVITNALGATFGGVEKNIRECLRYSINTCLADIEQRISNSEKNIADKKDLLHDGLVNYFGNLLEFGKPTIVDLPADSSGGTGAFTREKEVDFSAANWSFGQGFRITPLQIARAYTALGRSDGTLVEPFLVDNLSISNGKQKISATDADAPSNIARPRPSSVFNPDAVGVVQSAMQYTLDKYGLTRRDNVTNGFVAGYPIAAKTGTAQISYNDAKENIDCTPFDSLYTCNTDYGLYEHTFIGFGPVGAQYTGQPKFLILLKLSKARRGEPKNLSVATLGNYFTDMWVKTLEYFKVSQR
jgi:cell division protein FtsI/penicillin-binding protein 2